MKKKPPLFSREWKWFLLMFLFLVVLIAAPFMILQEFMSYDQLPLYFILSMIGYVVLMAGIYISIVYAAVKHTLLDPIEKLNAAARQITAGDFSVYIESGHTRKRLNELDELINSMNLMVEELSSNEMLKTQTSHLSKCLCTLKIQ